MSQGIFIPVCLAFLVRLLFLEDSLMRCFRQDRKAKAEVKLPFIWDTSAASDRLTTTLYVIIPGFCTPTGLRR